MDKAARQYVRKILLIHLGVLAGILAVVFGAAREIQEQTRRQSLAQAQRRQELLAWQSARGIENYYGSIIDNLDLIKKDEEKERGQFARLFADRTPLALAPILWNQLGDRVSHLFGFTRQNRRVIGVFPREKTKEAEEAVKVEGVMDWLEQVETVSISPLQKIGNQWAHMVCVPASAATGPGGFPMIGGGRREGARDPARPERPPGQRPGPREDDGRTLLVAVVPTNTVEERFLSNVQKDGILGARFVDEMGTAVASSRGEPAGVNLMRGAEDGLLAGVIQRHVPTRQRGSELIDQPARVGGRNVEARLVSVEPVQVADQVWAVVLSSPLSEVDVIVNGVFRRVVFWAMFLVVAVTATLLSTASHMIRGRLRLERMESEMLNRELAQARQIQLAWLPDSKVGLRGVDLAAINKPASHISGDFYDWFELPDGRTVVTIGDVTGHGIGAAFLMATTQLLIRTTMPRVKDPGRCLGEVNRQLCTQVFNGQFVTALILVIDAEERMLEVATAGHYPPLIHDGVTSRSMPVEGELVLGVEPESNYMTERFELSENYRLLLYTDGAIDARAIDGDRFRLNRLLDSLGEPAGSARELVQRVVEQVVEFQGTAAMADDLTLVALGPAVWKSEPVVSKSGSDKDLSGLTAVPAPID